MGAVKAGVSLLAASLVLFASACDGSSADGTNSIELPAELGVVPETDLPCPGTAVEAPGDFERVLGVVALPASPRYPNALQTSRRESADGTEYYFAKTGLWWRGDAEFEIFVPDELRATMAIGWGGPATLAHNVRVKCGLDDSWMVLPGGYWVTEPTCAAVIVRVGDDEQRVDIGLGRACSGQDEPPAPSDG